MRRCCVSYITGASNWYWLTVGQGLLSLYWVRVEGECFYFFCFFTFIPVSLSSLSLSFISSTLSSISFLPFSGRRHKMTLKGWRVVKPQHTINKEVSVYLMYLWYFHPHKFSCLVIAASWGRWEANKMGRFTGFLGNGEDPGWRCWWNVYRNWSDEAEWLERNQNTCKCSMCSEGYQDILSYFFTKNMHCEYSLELSHLHELQ